MNRDGVWPVVSARRMRSLDHYTIENDGVAADVLMESAGRSVVDATLSFCASTLSRPAAEVLVVCGRGNNGGDGLVVARHLWQLGFAVRAATLVRAEELAPDAAVNWRRAQAVGVPLFVGSGPLPKEGVVIDALFGTGLSRELDGEAAEWVPRINRARSDRLQVVSIDMPSGVQTETGQVLGCAIEADLTVALECAKSGLLLEPGRQHAGAVRVARIGIRDALPDETPSDGTPVCEAWSSWAAVRRFPARPADGHKGRFGHALIVAGSEGKAGAAALSANAALRAGAGLVTLGCPAALAEGLDAKLTEVMVSPLSDEASGELRTKALAEILALSEGRNVLALGPGLGTHPETREVVLELVRQAEMPLVIDADGLNALQGSLASLRNREFPTILTPHPGEAARLLDSTPAEINRDRLNAARRLSLEAGAVVLLKGAGSVIAESDGGAWINTTGGAYLASAGTGDVLTGMVTALLAQGLVASEAATLGAYLHGAAADRLAGRRGESGLLAGEIADELPACMQNLREKRGQDDHHSLPIESTLLHFPEP